jgi:hypothetical protein
MTSLSLVDRSTGEVVQALDATILLTAADVLPLADADTTALAEFIDSIDELRRIASEAKGQASDELVARLDASACWTMRFDGWELRAASPEAGTVSYDIDLLREALDELVASRVISREAAWNALEPIRPTVEVSYRLLRDVVRALDGYEVAEPIFNEVNEILLTEPDLTYRLKLVGVKALLKVPGAREAIEACAVSVTPLPRRVKVKRT